LKELPGFPEGKLGESGIEPVRFKAALTFVEHVLELAFDLSQEDTRLIAAAQSERGENGGGLGPKHVAWGCRLRSGIQCLQSFVKSAQPIEK
jgi:hypothetical protein